MRCTDAQVRRLMEELSKHGRLERAAMKAEMNRKTAAKYAKAGCLPSDLPALVQFSESFDEGAAQGVASRLGPQGVASRLRRRTA